MSRMVLTVKPAPKIQTVVRGIGLPGTPGLPGAPGEGIEPIPTNTLLGNNTGSTALPTDLQPDDVRNLLKILSQAETQAIIDGKLSLTGGTLTGKLAFSGTTHSGLCLNSLTTAQYNALTSASGDLFRDSTTDRIDARLARGTVELIDSAGGQTIAGNLAATTLMVGGASGPLLRNNAGVIEARTNNNGAQAVLSGSAIDVTTLQIAGASVGTLVNNSGFARLVAMIAARFNTSAGNSIYCTDALESTTRVAINRGDDGTILITGQGSFGWSNPSTDVRVQSVLLGFDRLDANTIEINNGTAGTFRDLSLRNLTASGTVNVQGNQDFFSGADYTRVSRAVGASGRLRIYRPNSTTAIAVQFGGGNDEMYIGQSLEGSLRVGGGNLSVGSAATLFLDSTTTGNVTFRGIANATMATLTGTGNLATVGTITYSSIAFPELVTNGGFDTDTAWAKGTGWTISGGVAVATGVTGFADIQQNLPGVEYGRTYLITFDLVVTSGTLQAFLGTSGSSQGNIGNWNVSGSHSYLFHKGPLDTAKTILFRANSTFTGTIDNVSVKRAF